MAPNGPSAPPGSLHDAVALHKAGNLSGAEAIYTTILARHPNNADALYLLGTVRHQQGRQSDAKALLERALALKPNLGAAHNNLGKVYDALGQWDAAVACFHAALKIDANDAEALCNLGIAEIWRANSTEAEAILRRSLALNAKSPPTWSALGYALYHQNRTDDAIAAWRTALGFAPDFTEAHINLGTAQLSRMEFVSGWTEYAWRDRLPESRIDKGRYPQRRWRGEDPAGQGLLLVADQGLGDQILAAGVIPLLAARNIRLVIECEPRLVPLFARSFRAEVVPAVTPPQPATQRADLMARADLFDAAATVIKSPLGFARHAGYLRPDPGRVAAFRRRLLGLADGRRIIGISWASARLRLGAAKTSHLARDWADVLRAPDSFFVSLQYGAADRDLAEAAAAGLSVYRLPDLDVTQDIDGLAAAIAALDLVVSVSNTTVHLAGALNVPTWTIVSAGPARLWYWFEDRSDSLWYPSMRLFRQADYGRWAPVMTQVSQALRRLGPLPAGSRNA
ncbi:MAG: tetratricopeptide repeat protein [Rhodospirillaceae bacterium]|nr:tetratricopeptide repeat protein [Rhodospirillaceae bacterium]